MYLRDRIALTNFFFELRKLFRHPADREGLENIAKNDLGDYGLKVIQPFTIYLIAKIKLFETLEKQRSSPAVAISDVDYELEDLSVELYFQLQRFLLICTSFQLTSPAPIVKKIINYVFNIYQLLGSALEESNPVNKMQSDWKQLIVYDNWTIDSGIFTNKIYEYCHNVPRPTKKVRGFHSLGQELYNLRVNLEQYLRRKDNWYFKRSNELLNLADHLFEVLSSLEQGHCWVRQIYRDGLIEDQIILDDLEATAFYILYQIDNFMRWSWTSKRETTLDEVFNEYISWLTEYQLSLNPGEKLSKQYGLFLLRFFYPARVVPLLTARVGKIFSSNSNSLEALKSSAKYLYPLAKVLMLCARLSGFLFPEPVRQAIKSCTLENISEKLQQLAPMITPGASNYQNRYNQLFAEKIFNECEAPKRDFRGSLIMHSYFALFIFYFSRCFIEEKGTIQQLFFACYFLLLDNVEEGLKSEPNRRFAQMQLNMWKQSAFPEAMESVALYLHFIHTKNERKNFYTTYSERVGDLSPAGVQNLITKIKAIHEFQHSTTLLTLRETLLPALQLRESEA